MNNMITLQMHLHIQFLDATEIQTMSTVGCLMQIMSNNWHYQILLRWVQIVFICPYWIHISPFNFDRIWLFSHITKCHRKSCSLPSCKPTIIYYKTFREWQHPWPAKIRKCEHLLGPSLSWKIWKFCGGAKLQLYVIWVKKNSKHISKIIWVVNLGHH